MVLPVKRVSELFEQHNRIAVDSRMLTVAHYRLIQAVYIREIKIATKQQISRPPVVASQKRVHIIYAALTRSAVAEMSHVDFTYKRALLLYLTGREPICFCRRELRKHLVKYLLYGTRPESTLTIYVFVPRTSMKFHHSDAGTLLSTVVLLLHQ